LIRERIPRVGLKEAYPALWVAGYATEAQVENMIGRNVKVLSTYNMGYFTFIEFNDFCKEVDIKREKIVAHNPEKNEIVERKNSSFISAMNSMMHD
jgi:hypothetical protein